MRDRDAPQHTSFLVFGNEPLGCFDGVPGACDVDGNLRAVSQLDWR